MAPRRQFPAPARKFAFISRTQAIREAARKLQRHAWPRFEMLLIVALTGLAGFLASVLLLWLGWEQMWQRYPLAIGAAYLVFLAQLWLWMHARDASDGIDASNWDAGGTGGGHGGGFHGGGGGFGGGGASGGWDAADATALDAPFGSVGEAPGNLMGSVAEGADGEGCLVVIVLALVVLLVGSLFAAAVYVVSGAPMLMAELLVDGALSFGLYRNLRKNERGFWLFTALRRTGWLFLAVALLSALVGAGLAKYAPGSITLGQALHARHAQAREP